MAVFLNIAGLILNLIGVILLFRYGMPFRIRTEGKTAKTVVLPSAGQTMRAERRYDQLGWLGLVLIIVGTALQILATLAS